MPESLDPSIVCIMGRDGIPVGAGCLLTERHVVTCAHVVAMAINYDEYAIEKPVEKVPLEFFANGSDNATVEVWWPVADEGEEPLDGRADLALLALSEPLPPDAKPAKLVETDNIRYQNFDTIGFPSRHPLGLPVSGVCGGRRRDGRILVKNQTNEFEPGFSGAPVWIEAYGAVGGLLVARVRTSQSLAFVIPASLLRTLAPAVAVESCMLWVPDLPPGYVGRPELIAELKATLLATPAAVAVSGEKKIGGLHGMGGIGKTVLASAVVRDDEVRRGFPDGIYWLTLGQHANVIARQIRLAQEVSRQSEGFLDAQTGKARLEELLRTKRSLIVLDDVWSISDAQAFDLRGTAARLLLTTRYERVIEAVNAAEIKIPKLSADLALDMLAAFSGQPRDTLPVEAVGLVEKAEGLPLALAMAGRLAQDKPNAWVSVLRRLEGARIAAPIGKEEEFPYESVSSAIEASVEALSPEARELFLDLVVFPEDAPIPLSVLEVFWARRGQDALGVAEYAEDLVARSLATWDDEQDGGALKDRLILHDLVGGYLRHRVTDLAARHKQLIDAYRPASGKWADLPIDQMYIWNWLSFHLAEAGCGEELKAVLQDFDWMLAKIEQAGANALIEDYDHLPVDSELYTLQSAIRLSAHVASVDPNQLASQLVGRLHGSRAAEVKGALAKAVLWRRTAWLRPLTASLQAPGGALIRTLRGHNDYVNQVALSRDGRWAVSACASGTVRVWNLETGNAVGTLAGYNVALSGDGQIAVSSAKNTLKVWEPQSGRTRYTLRGHSSHITSLAVSADGRRGVYASRPDNAIAVWDLKTGRSRRSILGHKAEINCLAISADGRLAASASDDKTIKVWDLETGRIRHDLLGHLDAVHAVALTGDGRRAVSGSEDTTLKVWDTQRGRLLNTLHGHTEIVWSVAVGGRVAISASADRTLRVWHLESGRELNHCNANADVVAITPDGRLAVAGSSDQSVQVWDVNRLIALNNPKGQGHLAHSGWIRAVAVGADRAVSASDDDATLKVWDLKTFRVIHTLRGHIGELRSVAISEDGRRAVSAGPEEMLFVWDLDKGRRVRTVGNSSFTRVAMSRDGRRLVAAERGGDVKVWDLDSGCELPVLHGAESNELAISGDARLIAAASYSHGQMTIWDLEKGRKLYAFPGKRKNSYSCLSMSEDGRRLVSSDWDELHVWDIENGSQIHTLRGHEHCIQGVSVSRDGLLAVSACEDNTLKVWDIESGRCAATFTDDGGLLTCALTPDQRMIVAGGTRCVMHFLRFEKVNVRRLRVRSDRV